MSSLGESGFLSILLSGGGILDATGSPLGLSGSRGVGGTDLLGRGEKATMDEERTSYPYQQYTITTLRDEGVWWAKARVAGKDVGGDRPVLGGPWRDKLAAKTAAEAFCGCGKAG